MPLHIKKSLDELMNVSITRLQNTTLPNGQHLSATPGSVTRLLLAIINSSLSEHYTRLEEVHLQSFVSTASGEPLELIGEIVNCSRELDEADDVYRGRIAKQVTNLERANELAVRMALYSVNGVQDVHLSQFTHGSGSFTAFIITETAVPSDSILSECRKALADVVAYGIRYNVEGPDLVPVEIGIKLIMTNNGEASKEIMTECKNRVRDFINSRGIGEELIYNEIVEIVMSASEEIYDMETFEYFIDGVKVLNANQRCRYNERFIESSKPNAILVV